jgi:S-adenosylmethionine:tRNA ribosyltransferase-isomerase
VSGTPTSGFRYHLPEGAVAQSAVEPRHAARLLDADTMRDHGFRDLPALLSPGDLIVVNRTRVRRARLRGRKESGGEVEALLLRPLGEGRWEALVRPARRLRVGSRLHLGGIDAEVVSGPAEGRVVLAVEAEHQEEAVEAAGVLPLPPYFKGVLADEGRYQTVFAERVGSAAAPTAGLHFTPEVLERLERRGVHRTAVDLEIGIDTFRPISAPDLSGHAMHTERFRVGRDAAAAISAARDRGGRVVAVGTTVVRALESASRGGGEVEPADGETDLFITPGYRFGVVDRLITNFHAPGSTLVVLLAAFMGDRWRPVYETALGRGYRFLSFGDAMIVSKSG